MKSGIVYPDKSAATTLVRKLAAKASLWAVFWLAVVTCVHGHVPERVLDGLQTLPLHDNPLRFNCVHRISGYSGLATQLQRPTSDVASVWVDAGVYYQNGNPGMQTTGAGVCGTPL